MPPFRDSRNESTWGSRNSRNASSPRPRNTRFAPEFLESRLSPSTISFMPRTVQIATVSYAETTTPEAPLPTDSDGIPIPPPMPAPTPGSGGPA